MEVIFPDNLTGGDEKARSGLAGETEHVNDTCLKHSKSFAGSCRRYLNDIEVQDSAQIEGFQRGALEWALNSTS